MSADFRVKGASSTNHCWCQKTRVIAVSCGIKIFAVRCLVLSQYTHLTDRQTDGQNSDSNTVRCITCSRTVKTTLILNARIYHKPHVRLGRLRTIQINNQQTRLVYRRLWFSIKAIHTASEVASTCGLTRDSTTSDWRHCASTHLTTRYTFAVAVLCMDYGGGA